MVKIMYEEDVLEEEVIFGWHHDTRGSEIGVNVHPLVRWLETAEEESDDSE